MRGVKWLLSIYKVMRIRTNISSTLVVYQAALISYAENSDLCCKVVLEKCNLLQLLDVVRPSTYEKLEGEMVMSVEFNQLLSGDESISPKMTDACLSDETIMHLIVQYIKKYHVLIHLPKIMKHLEVKMKNPSLTEQRVEKIMKIFEEIMSDDNSNDKNLVFLDYNAKNLMISISLFWRNGLILIGQKLTNNQQILIQ